MIIADNSQIEKCCGCHAKLHWFTPIQIVGKGSFAKVILIKHNTSQKFYAMKVMHKDDLAQRKQLQNIANERKVMHFLDHPFIAKLRHSFQTPAKVFFVMDYYRGGELYFHLKKLNRFPEETARFFIAELALALNYVQKHSIVFRDLKAENVLMDHEGHLRLSDFGLAKMNVDSWSNGASTLCGTPHYIAPEIFKLRRYGFAVDWWALGILLYELIAGFPPFRGRKHEIIFEKAAKTPLVLLRSWPEATKCLMKSLLRKVPGSRLGSSFGPSEILHHSYFHSIDLDMLERLEITPPYKPDMPNLAQIAAEALANADLRSDIAAEKLLDGGKVEGGLAVLNEGVEEIDFESAVAQTVLLTAAARSPPLNLDAAALSRKVGLSDFGSIYITHSSNSTNTTTNDSTTTNNSNNNSTTTNDSNNNSTTTKNSNNNNTTTTNSSNNSSKNSNNNADQNNDHNGHGSSDGHENCNVDISNNRSVVIPFNADTAATAATAVAPAAARARPMDDDLSSFSSSSVPSAAKQRPRMEGGLGKDYDEEEGKNTNDPQMPTCAGFYPPNGAGGGGSNSDRDGGLNMTEEGEKASETNELPRPQDRESFSYHFRGFTYSSIHGTFEELASVEGGDCSGGQPLSCLPWLE